MKRRVVTLIALACCASAWADSLTRPAGFTQHDYLAVMNAMFRRAIVDSYDQTGPHPEAWEAPARALLERTAAQLAEATVDGIYRSGVDTRTSTMLNLAKAVDKIDDPVVQFCRAVAFKTAGRDANAASMLKKVVPQLLAGKYPPLLRYAAAQALMETDTKNPALLKQRDEQLVALLTDKPANTVELRYRWKLVTDDVWEAEEVDDKQKNAAGRQALLTALAGDQNTDPWLLNCLRGEHEITTAWEARGNGWAYTVTREGWAAFDRHIAEARKALTAAYAKEPKFPEAAGRLITVCMAESDRVDDSVIWFNRATAVQLDYMPAWNARLHAIKPRWGGSLEQMFLLGRQAVESKRFDTEVPLFVTRCVYAMTDEDGIGYAAFRLPGVWEQIAAAYDGYLEPLAKGVYVPWMGSRRAMFAWRCGQYGEAVGTLEVLGDLAVTEVFSTAGTSLAEVRDECVTMSGPVAADAKEARAAEIRRNYDAGIRRYEKLLAKVPDDGPTRRFALRGKLNSTIARQLAAGEKASVKVDSIDALRAFAGDPDGWTTEGDAMVYAGKPKSESTLLLRGPFPARHRIKFDWWWSTGQPGKASWLDLVVQDAERYGHVVLRSYARDGVIQVLRGPWGLIDRRKPELDLDLSPDKWHSYVVEHDGDTLTVWIDGKLVLPALKKYAIGYGNPMIGFTAHASTVGGTIKVRNLVIENLPKKAGDDQKQTMER